MYSRTGLILKCSNSITTLNMLGYDVRLLTINLLLFDYPLAMQCNSDSKYANRQLES